MSVVKNSDAALQPLRERILAAGRAGTPLVIRGHGSKARYWLRRASSASTSAIGVPARAVMTSSLGS